MTGRRYFTPLRRDALMPFREGDRVRLHSGRDFGTVKSIPSTFHVLVEWDSGSHGSWHVNELVRLAESEPSDGEGRLG